MLDGWLEIVHFLEERVDGVGMENEGLRHVWWDVGTGGVRQLLWEGDKGLIEYPLTRLTDLCTKGYEWNVGSGIVEESSLIGRLVVSKRSSSLSELLLVF